MKILITFLLFITSFTAQTQLTLEKDINLEAGSSEPGYYFAELEGIIYFSADDGTNDTELYAYDPATEESSITANLRTKAGGNGMYEIIAYQGKIYYSSIADGSTRYLYAYDPETKETVMVRDSENQRIRIPSDFYVYNDLLFYRTEINSNADEVHMYDGTTGDDRSLGNINLDSRSIAGNFTSSEDRLYFKAVPNDSGSRIFYYDIITDTIHRYIYEEPSGTFGNVNQLTHIDGWLFFSDNSLLNRGTTTAINISTGISRTFSIFENVNAGENPNDFFAFGGKLFFSAFSSPPKRALYAFDTQTEEITKELEVDPDFNTSPNDFNVLYGKLYFSVQVEVNGQQQTHLYRYDPITGEYEDVTNISGDDYNGYFEIGVVYEDKFYCSGYKPETGRELYTFDPTTDLMSLEADINTNTASASPFAFTEYDGQLYFTADEYLAGSSLWRYNPETGVTEKATDNFWGRNLVVLDGKLYFDGSYPNLGYGLNYFDASTGEVVATNWRTPNCINCMNELIVYDDKIYMNTEIDETIGYELYAYDPISDSGALIVDIKVDGDGRPEVPLIYNDDLYFEADREDQTRLFRYNATTQVLKLVEDIDTKEVIDQPEGVTPLNGQLYFSGRGTSSNYELYSYDPILEKITQLTEEDSGMRPESMLVLEDKLYFSGKPNNSIGRELHSFDPATGEVILELDLTPGGSSSSLLWSNLTTFNNKIYFSHSTDEFGSEFWEYTDGEAKIIADIRPGILGSMPELFFKFNDKLYFRADDGKTGEELWSFASCINAVVESTPESATEQGTIDLTVTGGTPPYIYIWNDGTFSEDRTELEAGDYSVIIYDQSGCVVDISVVVPFLSSNEEERFAEEILIYPNPTTNIVNVDLSDSRNGTLYLRTPDGNIIFAKQLIGNKDTYSIDLSSYPSGMYMLQIVTDTSTKSELVMKAAR